ncbi:MAG TPA: PilT/PilU family type 4a pilus ATPase [Candidatus Paceibacterota bacterium]|nr:PilT/PilU family type 4a pilus ATPase [Candidatus Paceibacterota bacterium]
MEYKKIFEELVETLIREEGSDLHLATGRFPAIRINGELVFLLNRKTLTQDDMEGIVQAVLSPEHYKHFQSVQDLDFSYEYQGSTRLRGNVYVQQSRYVMVLRLIPHVKALQELNLPPILADFSRRRQGFFLAVGPVGQGKSATLSSMVGVINEERAAHILTIEDPVEYVYEQKKSIIDQREIGIDAADFHIALHSAFRQDVNVILIGEMRDPETIGTAVTAAETGHLVLSTLHTNNASQTVDRIIDSFPGTQQEQIRIQLASSLIGIFSQRLVPRITGGRIPAYELLINNNAVANLIREKRTHEIDTVIETGFEQGMVDMNRSLLELVRSGDITIENAYAYSLNPKNLERLL